jgi:hypothetical protein
MSAHGVGANRSLLVKSCGAARSARNMAALGAKSSPADCVLCCRLLDTGDHPKMRRQW